jgi:hypothetical protein
MSAWLAETLRPGSRARRLAPVTGLLLVLAVLSAVLSRPPPSGLPLDPRSADSEGTKALALVLQRLGAHVDILAAPPSDASAPDLDVVLVLVDHLDVDTAEQLRDHARAGGVLVVTDPDGQLAVDARVVGSASSGLFDAVLRRDCELPALSGAAEVRVGLSSVLAVPEGAVGCYTRNDAAWLVAQPLGAGTIVVTGGPAFVTNSLLGEADNAVLAAALLAPRPGTRVGILAPDFAPARPDQGPDRLVDRIPPPLRLAALQLIVAFVLVALWRSRRLGKPVAEPQEVQLPGSELVVAVGTLLHRTAAHNHAVEVLRNDLRHTLSERLGLPEHTDTQLLADTAAARTTVTAADILAVLAGPAPRTDTEFVALAQRAEAIRHAILAPVASGA